MPRSGRLYIPFPYAVVGGAVRDSLLGIIPPKDVDILAVGIAPEELRRLGCIPVEAKTSAPVFIYKCRGKRIEVSLPKRRGRDGIVFDPSASVEDDLRCRDFTVNAVAVKSGKVIDPLGGVSDLESGILRMVSPENLREDPLRVIRGIRLASTLGFGIDPETWWVMKSIGKDAYASIPMERFFGEFRKALEGPNPRRFIELLLGLPSAMAVFMPELGRMATTPAGPLEYHPEGNLLAHSLDVLEGVAKVSPSWVVRMAGFYHDLGKLATPRAEWPKHHGHDKLTGEVLGGLRMHGVLPRKVRKAILLAGEEHMRVRMVKAPGKLLDIAARLRGADLGPADLSAVVKADSRGTVDVSSKLQKAWDVLNTPVDLPPGKEGKEAGVFIRGVRGNILASLLKE